jgi:hypothetical protein
MRAMCARGAGGEVDFFLIAFLKKYFFLFD